MTLLESSTSIDDVRIADVPDRGPLTAAITAFFAAARSSHDGTILLPDDPPGVKSG